MQNYFTWYNLKMRLVFHIIFWILVAIMYYYIYSRIGGAYIWIFISKELFVSSSLFYSASWIISRWVSRGRVYPLVFFMLFAFIWWVVWTYLTCYAASFIIPESDARFNLYLGFFLNEGFIGLFRLEMIGPMALDFISMASIPLAPKLTKVLLENSTKMVKMERDNLIMELDFLKSQISSHFLFNILNSIYRMSEKNDPETPNTILQLSNMLRYILYEGKNDEIILAKEVDFINNYINLARLRYGNKVPVISNVESGDEPYKVVPLILIPFVENAFKHGPDRSRNDSWVEIILTVKEDRLFFSVRNGINRHAEKPPAGGIGLQNAKRKLELHYPKRHRLDIDETDNSYMVELVINLKEHD